MQKGRELTYLKGGIRELKPEIELGISQFLNFHCPSKFWLFNKLTRKSSRFDALQKCVPFWRFGDLTTLLFTENLAQSQILSFHCTRDL
jgi:hypothetical protein